MTYRILTIPVLILAMVAGSLRVAAQGNDDYQAAQKLQKAKELLSVNEEERAVKLLSDIPRMHPKSERRFDAYMELGKHYERKNQNSLAIKQYQLRGPPHHRGSTSR
jgi:Tfp pilus assembly protein PilF